MRPRPPHRAPWRPDVTLRETHGSWVVLLGDRALKIKKPVRFAFMDYASLEARRHACEEEVRVNEDLAPGTYLGVLPITSSPPYIGGDNAVVDYAVEMRRYDEASTMLSAVVARTLSEAHVVAVAKRIARFHAAAKVAADPGQPGDWLIRAGHDVDDLETLGIGVGRLRSFCAAAARGHASMMAERAAIGLVRDGHGDLRADHVLLTDPVAVVDRIEFSTDLRMADVADDLAFLTMDLERLGARWAADLLVAAYAAAGGRPAPARLAALFAWRRALVSAKVALIRVDAPRAADHLALAERLAWRARAGVVLAVIGPPASGKSTLAGELSELLELPIVASDVVRKRLHGLAPTDRGGAGMYSAAATERVYNELARMAAELAGSAGGVIVDATYTEPRHRDGLARTLPGVRWIVCEAPAAALAARAAARAGTPSVSDAGPAVALALSERFAATSGLVGGLTLDTRRDRATLTADVAAWLDQAPPAIGTITDSTPS